MTLKMKARGIRLQTLQVIKSYLNANKNPGTPWIFILSFSQNADNL